MKTIDQVGRIGIPKDLRTKYNLTEDTQINIVDCGDYIKIVPELKAFKISTFDMFELRKLFSLLDESSLLDEHYTDVLTKITKRTNKTCPTCGKLMFENEIGVPKCYECE